MTTSDLGQLLFDQANAANHAAVVHITIGRQQVARDVEAWIKRNTDPATGIAHTETLLALIQKDLP